MSAPDIELEKQTKRHRPSLMGIAAAIAMVVAVVVILSLTTNIWGSDVPAPLPAGATLAE